MNKKLKTRVLVAAKICVSAGLLALLINWIDIGEIKNQYANIIWKWLIIGILIQQGQILVSTLKWTTILKADGQNVKFFFLWKTYVIGNFLSLFLPSSFGGDVYRVWALKNSGTIVSKSTASVLFDRFSGLFALLSLGIIGASIYFGSKFALIAATAYITGIGLFIFFTSDFAIAKLPEGKSKISKLPIQVLNSFNVYRKRPQVIAPILGLSFIFQFNLILIVACYAQALRIPSTDVSFIELLTTVPAVYLTEVLPISINGIGVRDGAFVFFFKQVGGTAEQALALSLLIVAIRYLKGLFGGIVLLTTILKSSENNTQKAATSE